MDEGRQQRDQAFRREVAEKARAVVQKEMTSFQFVGDIGGDEWAYETGDSDVNELIDLLEHQPKQGGFLGVSETTYQAYMSEIENLIRKLETT